MAKRADNDATMDISASQLVPDAPSRPRAPDTSPRGRAPKGPMSPNDMSVWKQVVVGTDDFAPPPKAPTGRGRRWVLAGALGVAVAGGGAFAWYRLSSDSPAPAASTAAEPAKPAADPPAPASGSAAAAASAPAQPAEAAAADPAPSSSEPAEPTWLESLASSLALEPTPMSWFDELGASFAAAFPAAPAPAKKPAASPKRTAATPKKGAVAPKKGAAAPKKPAAPPPKRR